MNFHQINKYPTSFTNVSSETGRADTLVCLRIAVTSVHTLGAGYEHAASAIWCHNGAGRTETLVGANRVEAFMLARPLSVRSFLDAFVHVI